MTGGRPLVLGHLGNTIEAFRACRSLGVDGVELDVRRGADGVMAVHHDADVPGFGPLLAMKREDLPPLVPRLEDALTECAGLVANIEIKNFSVEPDYDEHESLARSVADLVTARRLADDVIVSSFSITAAAAVREANPAIPTALLLLPQWDPARSIKTAVAAGHRAIHPHERSVTAELVDTAHAAGLRINAWAVDEPSRARQLVDLGVDLIITDAPAPVLAALGPRQ